MQQLRHVRFIALSVVFVSALLFFGGLYVFVKTYERAQIEELHEEGIKETKAREAARGLIMEQMAAAYTVSEWEALALVVAQLPEDVRPSFDVFSKSKLFEARFFTQEHFLGAVRKLLSMNENDPVAARYLQEAQKIHEANVKILAEIPELLHDCAFNAELNYLKGVAYYRGVAFLKTGENAKARDLLSQSLESFQKVLVCFPKDNDAEVAIEFLYKSAESSSSGATGSGQNRLQVFPSGEEGERGRQQRPGEPGAGGGTRERGRH